VRALAAPDGVVGDFLCEKYHSLKDSPLTLRVKDNRLVEAHSENKELESDFWNYTHTDENSDRVGEFAIGTNIELKEVIGHILQDEKFPGIHIAFGNPYGVHTGADWFSARAFIVAFSPATMILLGFEMKVLSGRRLQSDLWYFREGAGG